MSEENKGFDIKGILVKIGNNIDEKSKAVITEHEEDLKKIGKDGFYEAFRLIFEGKKEEFNIHLQTQLLMALPDDLLLQAKRKNLESLKTLADLKIKREKIAKDFISSITKDSANIMMNAILLQI